MPLYFSLLAQHWAGVEYIQAEIQQAMHSQLFAEKGTHLILPDSSL